MNRTSRTRLRRIGVATLPVSLLFALSACTSSDDAAGTPAASKTPDGYVSLPPQAYSSPDADTALGASDEPLPTTIPEKLHVGTVTPITKDDLVTEPGGFGQLELGLQVLDPTTGKTHSRIVVGPGIWDAVVHAFIGTKATDPAVLAGEVWRPRGSRGKATYTVSTYSGNLLDPDEAQLPDYARLHSRAGSHAVTSDGRYFVSWDDALYGIRVVDLKSGKESGALQIKGCGPFTWTVGHDVYSVCEDTKEIIKIGVNAQGKPKVTGRAKVLPSDFDSARTAEFAADAKKGFLVAANGDVYVLDFSDGLPTAAAVKPIGNAGRDEGRFADNAINSTATSMAVSYTDSDVNPDSARAGDVTEIVLHDASFKTIGVLSLKKLGLTGIDAMTYAYDGKTLYVVGAGPASKSGDAGQKVVGVDATTGKVVSSKAIKGALADVGGLITPESIG